LGKAVEEGRFRKDLYFRIDVFPLELPALRDRAEDIILLAEYFIKKISLEMKKKNIAFSRKAKEKLQSYKWPGNIRELLNTIERAIIICKGNEIKEGDIILPEKPFALVENANFSGNLKQVTTRVINMVEKIKIEQVLKEVDYNKTRAAETLEISYKSLLNKIKAYDIATES
jgi:DNA-binding NtrC family response regulator